MGPARLRRSILAAISAADLEFKLADFFAAGGAIAAVGLLGFDWKLLNVVQLLSVVLTVADPAPTARSRYIVYIWDRAAGALHIVMTSSQTLRVR